MDQYKKVFEAVSGEIDIDTRYSPEEYLEMLSETQIYNADIINMCDGLPNIVKLPKITLPESRFRGDYIDFLGPEDLNAPMTRGIDPYGRPFISFLYKFVFYANKVDRYEVETMFQRYSGNSRIWTSGGAGKEISMGCSRITDKEQCGLITEHLLRLIRGEPVGYMRFNEAYKLVESDKRVSASPFGAGHSIVSLFERKLPKALQADIIEKSIELRFRPGNGGYSESLESFNEISERLDSMDSNNKFDILESIRVDKFSQ